MNCKSSACTGQYHTALKPPQLIRAETVYISMEHLNILQIRALLSFFTSPTLLALPHGIRHTTPLYLHTTNVKTPGEAFFLFVCFFVCFLVYLCFSGHTSCVSAYYQ